MAISFSDTGFGGDDTIKGAGGNDLLFGGRGNDLVDGEAGQDQLAGLGDDGLLGGDGDDTMSDGGSGATETGGNDDVNGQGGTDIAAYQRQADVSVSLDGQANDGIAGEADNVQVEDVFAGSGNDTLIGDDAENLFAGQAGNDQIFGLGGGDALIGGSGDDLHDGGAGRDAAQCGAGYDAFLVQPEDTMVLQCERTGAEVAADTATVSKENTVKVRVRCPVEEGAACAGTLVLSVAGKGHRIGRLRHRRWQHGRRDGEAEQEGEAAATHGERVHVSPDRVGAVAAARAHGISVVGSQTPWRTEGAVGVAAVRWA